ncbi:MAG TPA: hypothetical protein VFW94_00620 [Candidatus Acidoferrales bacterium]|nr:hypothetical protein [Candidatus Acidoferrales bacterium]
MPDGTLAFKMYAPSRLPALPPLQPGSLVPHSLMYRLRAVDLKGREWTSDFVSPDQSASRNGGAVIKGTVWDLVHSTKDGAMPVEGMDLYFLDDLAIPVTAYTETKTTSPTGEIQSSAWDRAIVESPDYRIDFHYRRSVLSANVVTDKLRKHSDLRVVEALQFLLARAVRWNVKQRTGRSGQETHIRCRPRQTAKPRLHKPIQFFGGHDLTGSMWALFQKYYDFASSEASENWHPVSIHLHNASEASAASVDTQRLALGIAVEGIAAATLASVATHAPDQAVRSILAHLDRWQGMPDWPERDSFRDRVKGLFGLLRMPRAKDRLWWAAARGFISDADVRAWSKLRNAAAHPDELDPSITQKSLALIEHVTTVMYKLVFAAIGYEGAYTDYSTRGWPTQQFSTGGCVRPFAQNPAPEPDEAASDDAGAPERCE